MNWCVILLLIMVLSSVEGRGPGDCDGVDCGPGKYCQTFGKLLGIIYHDCMQYSKEGEQCNARMFKCSPELECVINRKERKSSLGYGNCTYVPGIMNKLPVHRQPDRIKNIPGRKKNRVPVDDLQSGKTTRLPVDRQARLMDRRPWYEQEDEMDRRPMYKQEGIKTKRPVLRQPGRKKNRVPVEDRQKGKTTSLPVDRQVRLMDRRPWYEQEGEMDRRPVSEQEGIKTKRPVLRQPGRKKKRVP